MDAGYFPQRCSLATSCSLILNVLQPLAVVLAPFPGTKGRPKGREDEHCGGRCLSGCCWGTGGTVKTAPKLAVSYSSKAGRTAVTPHLPFCFAWASLWLNQSLKLSEAKTSFLYALIKHRVHFMLLLAQVNTSASWHSLRTAVHSINTEERANAVCVPVSP